MKLTLLEPWLKFCIYKIESTFKISISQFGLLLNKGIIQILKFLKGQNFWVVKWFWILGSSSYPYALLVEGFYQLFMYTLLPERMVSTYKDVRNWRIILQKKSCPIGQRNKAIRISDSFTLKFWIFNNFFCMGGCMVDFL